MDNQKRSSSRFIVGVSLVVVVAGLAACEGGDFGARDEIVTVYRGLDAKKSGKAVTSPSQFRFNPDMSTFDAAPDNKPCAYAFEVNDGAVTGLPGYTAAATPPPPGHWSINQPANVTPDEARDAISVFVKANPAGFIPASCAP